MKIIVHFKKPEYEYVTNAQKKPIKTEVIHDAELIISSKDQLVVELKDGSSVIYEPKNITSIVVKEEKNENYLRNQTKI